MKFRVTPEDFLKGGLPTAGWHPCTIKVWDETGVSGPEAKNPGSQFTKCAFEITAGPDKGKYLYANYSEIAPAMMAPLVEAVNGVQFNKKEVVEFEVSQASMQGKFVDVHCIAGSYQNKPKREVDGYRAYSGPKFDPNVQAGV